jgi:hypothetical protein
MTGIKVRVLPWFPNPVIGGAGIDVKKANGNWTISLDYAKFGLNSPYTPQPGHRVVILTESSGNYFTVPTSVLASGPVDPSFSSVKLLMGFNGTNGSTGAPGMTDESLSAHGTATVTPDATISTTNAKAGASSLWLTRTVTGRSMITFPTSSDWDIGAGRFTLELFFIAVALNGGGVIQPLVRGPNDNWMLWFNGTNLAFTYTNGVTPVTISDGVTVPNISSWYYGCVDFDGTKYRLYHNLNGNGGLPLSTAAMAASSTTLETIASSATVLSIGETSTALGRHPPEAYLDELRFTKGVARYATDAGFPVPLVPFPRH